MEAQSQWRESSDPTLSVGPAGQPQTLTRRQAELVPKLEVEEIEEKEWAMAQERKSGVDHRGSDRAQYRDRRA